MRRALIPILFGGANNAQQTISIINGSANTLTDYQVRVPVVYDIGISSDFANVRFVSATGATLSYWRQEYTASGSAVFWVKVPSIPASATTVIYRRLASLSSATTSSIDNTMVFGDDFRGAAPTQSVRFGIFSSPEIGDQTTAKLSAVVAAMNTAVTQRGLSFVVNLDDFISFENVPGATTAMALAAIASGVAITGTLPVPFYDAISNHDVDLMSKTQWLTAMGQAATYFSFDVGSFHFVVLDQDFRTDSDADPYDDGNFDFNIAYVPPDERTWLAADLAATSKKTIVFCSYPLTAIQYQGDGDGGPVTNAAAVRTILEASGKVLAVFSGHNGGQGNATLNNIHYIGMRAMDLSTPNAYSEIVVGTDNTITIVGYGEQKSPYFGYNAGGGSVSGSKWALDNTPVITNGPSLVVASDAVGTWEGIVSTTTFNSGIMEAKFPSRPGESTVVGLLKPQLSGSGREGFLIAPFNTEVSRKYVSNTGTAYAGNMFGGPYQPKFTWDGTTATIVVDGTTIFNQTISTTALKVVIESFNIDQVVMDYVFVRVYTPTEPTIVVG